jgi:hypothetical protein
VIVLLAILELLREVGTHNAGVMLSAELGSLHDYVEVTCATWHLLPFWLSRERTFIIAST